MYDPDTARVIRGAPALSGLDVERLPEQLSEIFAKIAAARVRLRGGDVDRDTVDEILGFATRLALTNEALVAIAPAREDRRSAAFVAGTAYQLVFQAESLLDRPPSAYLRQQSISPDIAAMLLFLIGHSTADAAEVARQVRYFGTTPIEAELIRVLGELALGRARELGRRSLIAKDALAADAPVQTATSTLYYRLLEGVRALALRLTAPRRGGTTAADIFREVQELSASTEVGPFPDSGSLSVFAGPHHLAALLLSVEDAVTDGAVVATPPPTGVDGGRWESMVQHMATTRPYLWRNHRDAIGRGYLERGVSAAVAFPTGSGKSILCQLKMGATLLGGRKVLFLAPTHALVDQTAGDLKAAFPGREVRGELDAEFLSFAEDGLEEIWVATPEACLARAHSQPDAFEKVGLLVFDECHLLHPGDTGSRRSIDAMLCILNVVRLAPDSDLLLVSAMMQNADEIVGWLGDLTGRPAVDLSLQWKPTRQLRGCVVYEQKALNRLQRELHAARRAKRTGGPPNALRKKMTARPKGLFSVKQTWASVARADYVLLPFLDEAVALAVSPKWSLTPNAGEVSAALATAAAGSGIKTLVFSQSVTNASAIAKRAVKALGDRTVSLSDDEKVLLGTAIDEIGHRDHIYLDGRDDDVVAAAAVHHGQLLSQERRLTEELFKRADGLDVLAATPTLGQGVNLPAEFVIIADDSRYNQEERRRDVLDAHDLLNAAGRAGRAGQNATGIVVVVPGKVVGFEDRDSTVGPQWLKLREVFSQSDQCLVIDDPLEALLDRIHAQVDDLGDLERYCLTRLVQPVYGDQGEEVDQETLPSALSRSFAAYRKRQKNDEAWVRSRIASAISFLGDQTSLSDEDKRAREIASATGLPEEIVAKLSVELEADLSRLDASVAEWTMQLMAWIGRHPALLPRIVRAADLESQFGTAHEKLGSVEERTAYGLPYLQKMLEGWMAGETLKDIQAVLPPSTRDEKKLTGARKFVVRIVPTLVQFFKLPALVLALSHRGNDMPASELPAAVAALSRCVRRGYDSAELEAFRVQSTLRPSNRRAVHRQFESLTPYLTPAPPDESWDAMLRRVKVAIERSSQVTGLGLHGL